MTNASRAHKKFVPGIVLVLVIWPVGFPLYLWERRRAPTPMQEWAAAKRAGNDKDPPPARG